ncbi:putative oxidoreductase C terminal-domain-containing protein [Dichomitus squalens]|uniref:Putative oxidoreductase C terminal-domain-containing protein n=1 Tax=Dichomitus squalens TaxID=114155 RepID=A0A4Q9MBU5_9APHY|nr:putative oxidoreductase C terminal-domain-containing protein [Dichomitus squalens]
MSVKVNVLLVGAGEINFGSVEGPWNHTSRLEKILTSRLRIVALVDPDQSRAFAALQSKLASAVAGVWKDCNLFPSVFEAAASLSPECVPQIAIVGAPPFARGTDIAGRDLELQLLKAFPACALFIEKPVSSGPEEASWRVAQALATHGTLVGVGYMLRYLKAVQLIKKVISDNGLVVMGTNARYVMAYEWARKPAWWDKSRSGGPIIEQATHFCDLSRYFGGDVHLPSVVAHTVQHNEPPGELSAKRFDEDQIPAENRLPRLTSATWKYTGGAVGTLTHVIALHGTTYDTEFEVYADGYHFRLVDPYSIPKLYIRRPGVAEVEAHTFTNDDPFHTELATFVGVVEGDRRNEAILSSYEDAIKTYELTWAIRRKSERAAEDYNQNP